MFSTRQPFEFAGFEPEFAAALARALNGETFEAERCWNGAAASFHVLHLATGQRLLLKQSLAGEPSLRDEITILQRGASPNSPLAAAFPAFHGEVEGFDAFLAQFVPGENLREFLRERRASADLPARLLDTLRHYHEVESNPLGDFHAGNVMIHAGSVILLNPAPPDKHGREPGEQPMASDVGFWIASAAHYLLSDMRRAPKVGWRLFLLNRRIIREASTPGVAGNVSRSDLHRVAARQLRPLLGDPSLVSRVSYLPSMAYIWALRLTVRSGKHVKAETRSQEAVPRELPGA